MSSGDMAVAVDGLAYGMLLFTVAAGLGLSYGVAGMLNLAHGSSYLLGAYLGLALISPATLSLGVALAAAVAAGIITGIGVAALLQLLPGHLEQALGTIGLSLIGAHLLTQGFGPQPQAVNPPQILAGSVTVAGHTYPLYRLVIIALGLLLAAALAWTVHRTRAGVLIRAAAADPDMLDALGVEPRRVHTLAVTASVVIATVAGMLGSPIVGPAPGVDHTMLLLSLAIVIAGRGGIGGILAAALLIGQVQTTAVAAVPVLAPYLSYALLFLVLIAQARLLPRKQLPV